MGWAAPWPSKRRRLSVRAWPGIIGVETFRTMGGPALLPSQVDQCLQPFRADFAAATRKFVTGTLFRRAAIRPGPQVWRIWRRAARRIAGWPRSASLNKLDYASILPR